MCLSLLHLFLGVVSLTPFREVDTYWLYVQNRDCEGVGSKVSPAVHRLLAGIVRHTVYEVKLLVRMGVLFICLGHTPMRSPIWEPALLASHVHALLSCRGACHLRLHHPHLPEVSSSALCFTSALLGLKWYHQGLTLCVINSPEVH